MMSLKFLRYSALSVLGWLPLALQAQQVGSLSADPARAAALSQSPAAQRGSQALTLPFFDDFTTPKEGQPKEQNWLPGGGVLVNNRFPFEPPTRGVATLDALKQTGLPYGGGGNSDIDTLVSQPINLGGRAVTDRLYLGFYWQAGNIFRAPGTNTGSRQVSLQLEFKDNTGRWQQVWIRRSDGTRNAFRRKFVPIDQARFLHPDFQFRFRAIGDVSTTNDSWSIDYVKLAPVLQTADSLYRDVATSKPLSSLLARGTAMPVVQYNAASSPSTQLNPATFTTVNNLDQSGFPTPVNWVGTLQIVPAGPLASFPITTPARSLSSNERQVPVEGNVRPVGLPASPEPKTIRHTIALTTNEVDPLTLSNDTISRVTELNNYFAYDDGTAEANVSIPEFDQPVLPRYYALRFDLNRPDQVRSILISPSYPQAAGRQITVNIWDADPNFNGQPAPAPKATKSRVLPASLPAGQTFYEIVFDNPVPVSGRFFAGYGHGPISTPLPINIDFNNPPPADAFWQYTPGWSQPAAAQYPTWALMLRPVMTGTVTAVASPRVAAAYALYPNPSTNGQVQVQGTYARARVLDGLGRVAWQQPAGVAGQPTLDLQQLPTGVYVVELTLPSGLLVNKRLILAR